MHREAQLSLVYFFPVRGHPISEKEARYIDGLFTVPNEIITTHRTMRDHLSIKILKRPLSQQIITDLFTWRYGISGIKQRNLRFLKQGGDTPARNLLRTFDDSFGRVEGHRNVLQHAGPYRFGDQNIRAPKRSELKRIGFQPPVAGRVGLLFRCYIDDFFCSSDRKGNVNEVNLGPSLPNRIVEMVVKIADTLNESDNFEIGLKFDLDHSAFDKFSEHSLNSLSNCRHVIGKNFSTG